MNDYVYAIKGNEVVLLEYKGKDKNIVNPSKIEKKDDTTIGWECFYNNEEIETVKVPNTVTKIEDSVFEGCSNLKRISLSDNIVEIGVSCFFYCKNLEEIVIPKGVDALYCATFYGCNKLKKVDIKGKIQAIYSYCFDSCYSLEYIKIDGDILVVMPQAFASCTKLKKVVLLDLRSMQSLAFMGCDSLKYAILKFNDTFSVSDEAFEECDSLDTIYYEERNDDYYFESSIESKGVKLCKMVNLNERDWVYID